MSELKIPFVDLERQHQILGTEIRAALEPIFANADFILGPDVPAFEQEFATFCEAKHCITVSSGTAALQLALMAIGVGANDEVITVPNSFIATAEAISAVGAIPKFVDIDETSHTMNPLCLEAEIGPKTKAVIPVHLYGQSADMDPILSIAKRHGVKVVEDACQAHGAEYKGRRVGTFGEVGCFSFYPGKNLGGAGDGGAVVTNDEGLATHIRKLRDHGSAKKYEHDVIGHNFRLDTIQAAVLNVKLKYLPEWNEARRQCAEYYSDRLKNVPDVIVPTVLPGRLSVFHLYVIRVRNRAKVQQALSDANIQSGIHYPKPIHMQAAYRHLGLGPGTFPISEQMANEVLSLPIYPALTREQQERVVETIIRAVAERGSDALIAANR